MVLSPVIYEFAADNVTDAWRVQRFALTETLSDLYSAQVDLYCDSLAADPEALLGTSCALTLSRAAHSDRRLCGVVHRVVVVGTTNNILFIRIEIVPALWALTQSTRSRVFQNMTAVQVVEKVLNDGLQPHDRKTRLELRRTSYPTRESCVQYHETDFNFVQRLMHDEGIGFYFEHSGNHEEIVLVDNNNAYLPCNPSNPEAVRLVPPSTAPETEVVHALRPERVLGPTSVILHEYNWQQPNMAAHSERSNKDDDGQQRLVYDSEPALCFEESRSDVAVRAQIRSEQEAVDRWLAVGEANIVAFVPGRIFELMDTTDGALEGRYIITKIVHQGTAPHPFLTDEATEAEYSNRFTCIPENIPYRPRHKVKRPVLGMQTATVVGPSTEEIYTDEHGRIKVQFHWDRDGAKNENSSCWIRVMQPWAGSGFGTVFLPRIGAEVVVEFLQGNADRPLVIGCVYNAANRSPVELPQDKTRTVIASRSSPNGLGRNEVAFEDATGQEEISVHAHRDFYLDAGHDHSTVIGHDQKVIVAGDRYVKVEGTNHEETGTVRIVKAGNKLELSCGASKITLEQGGTVTINGPSAVKIVGGVIDLN